MLLSPPHEGVGVEGVTSRVASRVFWCNEGSFRSLERKWVVSWMCDGSAVTRGRRW